jgi:hypothetical protein
MIKASARKHKTVEELGRARVAVGWRIRRSKSATIGGHNYSAVQVYGTNIFSVSPWCLSAFAVSAP